MRSRMPPEPRSILVYVTSDADHGLGESVLKLPLLLALSDAYPDARITWVPGTSGSFYLRTNLAPIVDGRIDEFITDLAIPKDPRWSWRTHHPILQRHFDLIIDTQRYFGRSMFLRRIPHRRFISGTWRYLLSDAAPPVPLTRRPARLIDKLLGLAAAGIGSPLTVKNPLPLPQPFRQRAAELLPAGPVYVGLAPGAGNKDRGKCWPIDGFVALAHEQIAQNRVPVFLLGPEEAEWVAPLREALPRARFPEQDAAGHRDGPCLTAALGERLFVAVANCSGTGHLLAAGGAPMVSLYGPTRPEKYAPFSRALICLKAQDYGAERIDAIPLDAVVAAIERQVAIGPAVAAAAPERGQMHAVVGADLGR